MKKLFAVLAALLLVLTAAGCSQKEKTKTFTFENLSITVPESYKMEETSYDGFVYCLEGEKLVIFVNRTAIADIQSYGITEDQVSEIAYQGMEIKEKDGMSYGVYDYTSGSDKFYYTYGLFKDDTYYWDVNVACQDADKATLADPMVTILQNVELK